MKQKTTQILKHFLVALFVSYYCESTFFIHTHYFIWGRVTHSHPYVPIGSHSHTSTECQTIESLTNLLFTTVATTLIVAVICVIAIYDPPFLQQITRSIGRSCDLRAPPVLICQ